MMVPVLAVKLRKVILLRLFMIALFLTAGVVFFDIPPFVSYGIPTLFLALSLVYLLWAVMHRALTVLAYVQILFDLAAISILVYYTGSVDSALAVLYALVIMGAGSLLLPRAAMLVSVISCLAFSGTVLLRFSVFSSSNAAVFLASPDYWYVGYMLNLWNVVFLLVGYLTSRMVRTIGKMEREVTMSRSFSLLGEMTTHLAHEIKNPLMSISGSVELLCEELKERLTADQGQLMEAVVQESQRLKDLLDEVLIYAKPESLQISKVNLSRLLDEVFLLLVSNLQERKNLSVEYLYRKIRGNAFVLADAQRLKQVCLNLIVNALEAMPAGGILRVSLEKRGGQWRIIFEDTGEGMSRDFMKNLFMPFKSSKPQGTGMGLAIAHKIVHAHGGRILVKSRPGKGSRFTVFISEA